jgi:hypothetical protein
LVKQPLAQDPGAKRSAVEQYGIHARAVAEETALPISFHIKGGTSSKLSYRVGKWQSAAFATLLPLQLDERRDPRVIDARVVHHDAVDSALGQLAPAALAATGLSALFWMLICYGMKVPVLYGLGYPMGALMALYIILKSTWRGGRRVEWKGRVYEDKT